MGGICERQSIFGGCWSDYTTYFLFAIKTAKPVWIPKSIWIIGHRIPLPHGRPKWALPHPSGNLHIQLFRLLRAVETHHIEINPGLSCAVQNDSGCKIQTQLNIINVNHSYMIINVGKTMPNPTRHWKWLKFITSFKMTIRDGSWNCFTHIVSLEVQ